MGILSLLGKALSSDSASDSEKDKERLAELRKKHGFADFDNYMDELKNHDHESALKELAKQKPKSNNSASHLTQHLTRNSAPHSTKKPSKHHGDDADD